MLICDDYDRQKITRRLAGLPDEVRRILVNEYNRRFSAKPSPLTGRRRTQAQFSNPRRNANIYLREAIKPIRRIMGRVKIEWDAIRHEETAKTYAAALALELHEHLIGLSEADAEGQDYAGRILAAYRALAGILADKGLAGPMPEGAEQDATEAELESAILRMIDAKWVTRRVVSYRRRLVEHLQIAAGKVRRSVAPYISESSFSQWRAQQRASAAWLAIMELEHDQTGQVIDAAEASAAGVANPENRRVELMVRLRGFEELSEQLPGTNGKPWSALFLTLTCPSKYHYSSDKWGGADPREAQAYLVGVWAKIRAALGYRGITFFGFRIAEPHHDACPHWHLLVYVHPAHRWELIRLMRAYALAEDGNEPGAREHRFTVEYIDRTKGSATGYVAKYISKNINAAHMEGMTDEETATPAEQTAWRVRAWASWHKIRQFQQFGGAPVTIWRELRKVREPAADQQIEAARVAADNSRWADFCKAAGGLVLAWQENGVNEYNEPVFRVRGVSAGSTLITRLGSWLLRRKASACKAPAGAPWSPGNNCRGQGAAPAWRQQLADHLGKFYGFADDVADWLIAGRVVSAGRGECLAVRGGQLRVMRV